MDSILNHSAFYDFFFNIRHPNNYILRLYSNEPILSMNMIHLKPIAFALIFWLLYSCSITRIQKKGSVLPENFKSDIEFTTLKTVMIVPVDLNGISKNFLFDTGADYSVIQRDSIIGRSSNVSGATNRKMKMGEEYVASIKVGNIDFKNTFALNSDLIGLKEQIPNLGDSWANL